MSGSPTLSALAARLHQVFAQQPERIALGRVGLSGAERISFARLSERITALALPKAVEAEAAVILGDFPDAALALAAAMTAGYAPERQHAATQKPAALYLAASDTEAPAASIRIAQERRKGPAPRFAEPGPDLSTTEISDLQSRWHQVFVSEAPDDAPSALRVLIAIPQMTLAEQVALCLWGQGACALIPQEPSDAARLWLLAKRFDASHILLSPSQIAAVLTADLPLLPKLQGAWLWLQDSPQSDADISACQQAWQDKTGTVLSVF